MEKYGYLTQQSQDFTAVEDAAVVGQIKLKFGLREEIVDIRDGDSCELLQSRVMKLFDLDADYQTIVNQCCKKVMEYV